MRDLVVMDYSVGNVYTYSVPESIEINDEYIESLGYNIDEVSWMCCKNTQIVKMGNAV